MVEFLTATMGVVSQAIIQQSSFTVEYCQSMHSLLTGAYNLHVSLAIFYMYYLKKRIEDPTTSKVFREVALFVSMAIPTVLFSIGSGRFQCAYLDDGNNFDDGLTKYAAIISFWSILAVPVLQYLRLAINDACTGFLMKAMRTQLKFMSYLVHVIGM